MEKISDVVLNASKIEAPETIAALGGDGAAMFFTDVWVKGADYVQLAATKALIDYCRKNEFTASEFKAFKEGLGALPEIMMICATYVADKMSKDKKDID